MAAVNANDIVRVTARMFLDGVHEIVNVFHYKALNGNLTDADTFMVGVALAMNSLYTLVNPDVSTRLTYNQVEGANITQITLLPSKPWPILVAGTTGGELLPEMVAACVFFRTTRPKTRTSKFLGGYTELSNIGGAVTPGSLTNLAAYGVLAVGGFAADGAVMNYGAWNSPAVRFTPVVVSVVPARWRTQRRRRFGVGS